MRLRSDEPQIVKIPAIGLAVPFAAGEEMRTEVSAKFRQDGRRRRTVGGRVHDAALVDGHRRPVRAIAIGPGLSQ